MSRWLLFILITSSLILASCDPCTYHSHNQAEISKEGLTVTTIDNLGELLRLEDASWSIENEKLCISLDYGPLNKTSFVSVFVDGEEIGTIGTEITFSMSDTEKGRDFLFSQMSKGRHIVLITVYDEGGANGSGSLELEVNIPFSLDILSGSP